MRLRTQLHPGGVAPQSVEPVVASLFLHEHVDHDVDEVHQDPVGDATAFDVLWLASAFFEHPFLDRIGDRQGLARSRPVTDDEIVGELAEAAEIENEYVFGLLVGSGVDDLLQYGFQRETSST